MQLKAFHMVVTIIAVSLISLGLLGCGGALQSSLSSASKPVTVAHPIVQSVVHIDSTFGGAELKEIEAGLHEWEKATGGAIKYEIVTRWPINFDVKAWHPDPNHCVHHMLIVRSFSWDDTIVAIEKSVGFKIRGYGPHDEDPCGVDYVYLVIDKMNRENELKQITMHEVGHTLGMGHNTHRSIMNSHAIDRDWSMGLTSYDINEFWKLHKTK